MLGIEFSPCRSWPPSSTAPPPFKRSSIRFDVLLRLAVYYEWQSVSVAPTRIAKLLPIRRRRSLPLPFPISLSLSSRLWSWLETGHIFTVTTIQVPLSVCRMRPYSTAAAAESPTGPRSSSPSPSGALQYHSAMESEPASQSNDDLRTRKQQSPLASRRPKDPHVRQNASAPPSLFPLGYKEGFNQWVGGDLLASRERVDPTVPPADSTAVASGQGYRQRPRSTGSFR
jgi:hypothetical protein